MSTKEVYDFLEKKDGWYKSSLLIAKKIVSDLHTIDSDFSIKSKGFNDGKMYYLRGDKDVMGMVGAGGIGFELVGSLRLMRYQEVFAILIVILLMVTSIDSLGAWLRNRLK